MKKVHYVVRAFLIVFFWFMAAGGLIEGYYFIGTLSLFLGVWMMAMPDHYKRGMQKVAWVVVAVGSIILLGLLQWRGTSM